MRKNFEYTRFPADRLNGGACTAVLCASLALAAVLTTNNIRGIRNEPRNYSQGSGPALFAAVSTTCHIGN
jgi:hypothetical protein